MTDTDDLPEVSGYSRIEVGISAVVGIVAAAVAYWVAQGFYIAFELIYRVDPTVDGGGIGADWVAGNTVPWLDFLVALVHAADVIMGVSILGLLFIHWISFRRLADRMRQPGEKTGETVAADGGTPSGDGNPTPEQHSTGDSNGGETE